MGVAVTLSYAQMQQRVSQYLQDPTNARWDISTIGPFINDGYRDFCRNSKILKKTATLSVDSTQDPNTAFYIVPSDMLELEAVWNNKQHQEVTFVNALPWNWETISGVPTRYIYGDFGLGLIRLYPYPTTASTTLKVYYTYMPSDLTVSGDTPVIPGIYHLALVYYAVAQCYLQDGQYRDPTKGQQFMQLYMKELADASARAARRFNHDGFSIPYRHG